MFSNELDRTKHPVSSRWHGVVLGSTISLAVAGPLLSARTTPYFLAIMVASFLAAAAVRGQLRNAIPHSGSVSYHLAAFLGYAAISAAWGIAPGGSFLAVVLAILVALGSFALVQLFASEARANLLHMGEGLWAAFIFGLLYLAIEVASGQAIKIWLYNLIGLREGQLNPPSYFEWSHSKLVAVWLDDLKRNMSVLVMLLWPSVAAMMGTLAKPRSVILASFTTALTTVVVLLASHGTSKLALLAGLCTFGGAYLFPRRTGALVAMGWIAACLAVLPAALLAHRLDLHNAKWLEDSTRHRIVIWNYTAQQVLKAPLLGVGARTTYVLGPRLEQTLQSGPDEQYRRTLSTHSHSVYLQTWFELGLIGAMLLTMLGLAILRAIDVLAPPLRQYGYATFVSAAIMAASSYGMWQIWFIALFGLCAVFFGLATHLKPDRTSNVSV